MKINVFNTDSLLYPFRWLLLAFLVVIGMVAYYDVTGRRMFSSQDQQQWTSSGPGYHK